MATKKTTTKTTTTKKAPAKKPVTKKVVKKKAPAKKKVTKTKYTAEQVYSMIEQAAYFAAENDGFSKDPTSYWTAAEKSINAMIKKG